MTVRPGTVEGSESLSPGYTRERETATVHFALEYHPGTGELMSGKFYERAGMT